MRIPGLSLPLRLLALAVVIGALFLGAVYFIWDTTIAEHHHPLGKVRAADVVRIEMERGDSRIRFEKEDGRWRLVEPVADDADPALMAGLIAGLIGLNVGKPIFTGPESYQIGRASCRERV